MQSFKNYILNDLVYSQNKCVFYKKCVIPELYESNWCVISDTPSV